MSDLTWNEILSTHRLALMGVVNVTPDSFSDGGLFETTGAAVGQGLKLAEAGAEVVDIGGESTRPGSRGVDAQIETARVLPVIEALRAQRPELWLSIDTSKLAVAEAALGAGAHIVNDVTAGSAEGLYELVAKHRACLVLMHMRGLPRTMQQNTRYQDVLAEVRDYLLERARAAEAAGVPREAIALDPGIGFGKDLEGNLALLRGLPALAAEGYPVLVGTSRKSFLGLITGAPVEERLGATLASLIPAFNLQRGILRVHDVLEAARFRAVVEALGVDRVSFAS